VVPLAADQNFNAKIVTGISRRMSGLDLVHIRDAGLAEAPDQLVLAWAAANGRVLLTHDRSTLVGYAYERVALGESMRGVIVVERQCPIGPSIEDLLLLLHCTADDEWSDRVYFVPL
jgi:hypothetical protein